MSFLNKKSIMELNALKEEMRKNKKKLRNMIPKISSVLTDKKSTITEKIIALSWIKEFNMTSEANCLVFCFANREEDKRVRLKAYKLLGEWIKDGKIKKLPKQMINGLQIEPFRYARYMTVLFEYNPTIIAEKIIEICDDQRFIYDVRHDLVKTIIQKIEKNDIKFSIKKYKKKFRKIIANLTKKVQKIERDRNELIDSPAILTDKVGEIQNEIEELYREAKIFAIYTCERLMGQKEEEWLMDFAELLYEKKYMDLAARFIAKIKTDEMIQLALELFKYFKDGRKRENSSLRYTPQTEEEIAIKKYLYRNGVIPFEKKIEI
ncbi:MAG: hypothetical protein QW153_00910 [Candidatus Bilamarchaeaceae archaeon]